MPGTTVDSLSYLIREIRLLLVLEPDGGLRLLRELGVWIDLEKHRLYSSGKLWAGQPPVGMIEKSGDSQK